MSFIVVYFRTWLIIASHFTYIMKNIVDLRNALMKICVELICSWNKVELYRQVNAFHTKTMHQLLQTESVGWILFKALPLYWKHKATQKPISSSHSNCSLLLDSDWLGWMLSGLCNKVLVNWLKYCTCFCFVQKSNYDKNHSFFVKDNIDCSFEQPSGW